jgi:Na+/phosphate symporter
MEKDVAEMLIRLSKSLAQMLEVAFQAFRKLTEESIQEAEDTRKEAHRLSSELTKLLIEKSASMEAGKEWGKPFLSMTSSFDRMAYNIDGIVHRVKIMAKEDVSFSDRAIQEINDIFQEAMDLLEGLADLILTQDKHLVQHMGERVRSVLKIANGYSEGHEERLIQGVCMPRSSPIYLGILEALKGVLVHILEVSGKIVSLASKS